MWSKVCGVIAIIIMGVASIIGLSFSAVLSKNVEDMQCVPFTMFWEFIDGTDRLDWRGASYIDVTLLDTQNYFMPYDWNPTVAPTTSPTTSPIAFADRTTLSTATPFADQLQDISSHGQTFINSDYGGPIDVLTLSAQYTQQSITSDPNGVELIFILNNAMADSGYQHVIDNMQEAVDMVDQHTGPDSVLMDVYNGLEDAIGEWRNVENQIDKISDLLVDLTHGISVSHLPD
eukprot:GHVO01022211.1.p1 GENE.GHVO01022211.1~~GHVO01022211.1.p1  ORF type:complete len:232 (+),score=41.72 GHVO01022211.1:30-725(+)